MLSLPGGAPGAAAGGAAEPAAGGAAEPPADDDAPEATGAVATFFAAGSPVASSGALFAAGAMAAVYSASWGGEGGVSGVLEQNATDGALVFFLGAALVFPRGSFSFP